MEALDVSRALVLSADGLLSILSIDSVEVITGKQAQLTQVSDFCINRNSTDSFEFQVLISIQRKKTLALGSGLERSNTRCQMADIAQFNRPF